MNKLVKKTLAAVAALTLGTQAFAASGPTTVNINFPNVIILHYINDVTFDVPDTAFVTGADFDINEGSGGTLSTYFAPNISGNAGITITIDTALDTYTGTINNAWAVRALSATGVQVSIAITDPDAINGLNSTASLIGIPTVTDGTTTGQLITFASPGMSSGTAVKGSVMLNMDFTGVTLPGTHTGAKYTITAVPAP